MVDQVVKLKRNTTNTTAPSTSDIVVGELAISAVDGKIYLRKTDDTISAVAATGTSEVTAYTTPSSTTTTVIGLTCANVTSTSPIKVSIRVYDSSGSAYFYIVKNAEIYEGGALVAVGGDQKLVLETGDLIRVVSDTASSVDTIVSVMEQT